MSIAITINSGDDKPFAVDIERFPQKILLEKPALQTSLVPMGVFFLAFVLFGFGFIAALLVGIVLAAMAVFISLRHGQQSSMNFQKKRVMVIEAGLMKNTHWETDYSDFESVLMRRRQAKSGRTKTTYQIIELKHSNPDKTLPLFVYKTNVAPKERWKAYGELFDLPVVKEGY